MQSEGFKYLEDSCPSLLSELLGAIASADENSNNLGNRKRSYNSMFGLELIADGAAAESVNPNGRRFNDKI
ncbi:hypothetical protein RJ641_036015 [Dillenia turbinata]|uniref:Uncharacterized protein n=1 Tax=Dillenia turbinata TaxID=194707 RepID=A0AAN8ZCH1_9MAGN